MTGFPVLSIVTLLALSNAAMAAMPTVAITDKNSGRTTAIAVGQSLEVRLPSNPTTGYSWTGGTLSSAPIRQLRPPAFEPSKSRLLGAAGTQIFSYRGVAAGTMHLSFTYRRSWEHGPPAKRIDFTIVVRSRR